MKILLLQDNPEYAELLGKRLSQEEGGSFSVECATTLEEGLKRVAKGDLDVVLLELSLPDSRGLETFEKVQTQAPAIPVVILTHLDDEIVALNAVRKGAQDYLLKGEVEGKALPRVLRYAIERHKIQTELRHLSFVDELTGLYNRRGFLVLTQQQLKMSQRTGMGLLLLLGDLDGLKQINDHFGHPQGDEALAKTAQIFRKTFRGTDILGRLGGDEFAVLAIGARPEDAATLLQRLNENFENHNKEKLHPFRLSLSVGGADFDPQQMPFVEQLLAKADEALYENKRSKVR